MKGAWLFDHAFFFGWRGESSLPSDTRVTQERVPSPSPPELRHTRAFSHAWQKPRMNQSLQSLVAQATRSPKRSVVRNPSYAGDLSP